MKNENKIFLLQLLLKLYLSGCYVIEFNNIVNYY